MPLCQTTQILRSLKSSVTLSSGKSSGKPTVTLLGGSESTFGNRKRTVPSTMPTTETVKAVQATPIQVARKKRRSLPVLAGVLAGAAGFAGAAGLDGAGGGAAATGGVPG